ncbi:MAG: alpha/beta hydrolase [Pricia sp.]|nr:alpha/beta hydrolase [Pricia sp.]
MKVIKNLIVLVFTVCMTFSCSTDSIPVEREVSVIKPLEAKTLLDISYGNHSEQVYDIYLPADRTIDTKVLLLVHGGGWTSGDKMDMNGFKDFMLNELPDVAVVNINYRLADKNNLPHPMQINDLSAVVKDLNDKNEEYVISADLGFMGVSAGGHLSLLYSYAYDTEDQVKMVCSIVGPTNFLDTAYQDTTNPLQKELLDFFGYNQGLMQEASPLFQVEASAPPTILFYGGQDPLIPVSQGIDLAAKLTELNIVHEFTLYENEGHGWNGSNLLDTSIKLKTFIEQHL